MDAPQQFEPRDLLDDLIEGRAGALDNFRAAVELRENPPYLGASPNHLVWAALSEDLEALYSSGMTAHELLVALGMEPWHDRDVMEMLYPIAKAEPLYKPSAVVAGTNACFRYAAVEEEFGRTIGGIREMIHLPRTVAECLTEEAGVRVWSN